MSSLPPIDLPAALQSSGTAVKRALAGLDRDAAAVAAGSIENTSALLPALIDSRQQLLYSKAAAKLMASADEMIGTLIDVRA
jgi:hypothetical protein